MKLYYIVDEEGNPIGKESEDLWQIEEWLQILPDEYTYKTRKQYSKNWFQKNYYNQNKNL